VVVVLGREVVVVLVALELARAYQLLLEHHTQ
jgi:hypothetical protein